MFILETFLTLTLIPPEIWHVLTTVCLHMNWKARVALTLTVFLKLKDF